MVEPDVILATYRVRCDAGEVERVARWIAVEQTVEVPESLVDEGIIGQVRSVEPAGEGAFDIAMAYRADLAAGQLPQLLSLVYGNVSLRRGVRLVDLALPDPLLARFAGPRLGVAGLRALTGVTDRPLLATALKPRGLPALEYARMAAEFAEGGGDLVKDDHNLVSGDEGDFEKRVVLCQEAVAHVNERDGRRCLYVPFLHAPVEELERRAAFCVEPGVQGVMVAPGVLGFDAARALGEAHGLFLLAHPTFTGGLLAGPDHGIDHGLLYGTLFRLAGLDVSIFVNAGGRFSWTPEQCSRIADRLRAPLGDLAPGWPCPAGGMTLDRIPDMVGQFGNDTVLLIGGALLTAAKSVREGTELFREEIEKAVR